MKMDKPIVLENVIGLVDVDLSEVYTAVYSCQKVPSQLARFKKKEKIETYSKSILNHRIKTLTGRSVKDIEDEMCFTPDDPNEVGMDIETLELLAHFLILYSNGVPIASKSSKKATQSLFSSPPAGSYMESTRIETPTKSTTNQMSSPKSTCTTPKKSPKSHLSTPKSSSNQQNKTSEYNSDEEEQPSAKYRYIVNTADSKNTSAIDESKPMWSCTSIFICVFLLLAIIIGSHQLYQQSRPKFLLYAEQDSFPESHWSEARNIFSSKLKRLKESLPNQNRKSWLSISAAIKRTIQHRPEYPAALLLLANQSAERTAACLAAQIAEAAAEVLGDDPIKADTLVQSADIAGSNIHKNKQELTDNLHATLSSARSVALLQLERFNPQVAMTLHAFTDNANAPYKRAVIVMTLLDDSGDSDTTADAKAEELLVKYWGQVLGDDKVYALVSRVAVNVIEVRPEDAVHLIRACPVM